MNAYGPLGTASEAKETFAHFSTSFDGASLYMVRIKPPEGTSVQSIVRAAESEIYADEHPNIDLLHQCSTQVAVYRWAWERDAGGDSWAKPKGIEWEPGFWSRRRGR